MDAKAKFDAGKSIFPALVVFLLFAVLAGAWGWALLDRYEQQVKAEVTSDLIGTGKPRTNQLSAFLRERKGNARIVSGLLSGGLAQAWWQGGDKDLPATLRRTLDSILAEYGYAGAMILDDGGNIRFGVGRSVGLSAEGRSMALRALGKASPVFSDLYYADPAAPRKLMLDTFAPVMSAGGAKTEGVLVLRGDWDYMFSTFQPWPDQSRSGESLLARQDGAEVLFLNQLRHQEQAADRLRVPLTGDASSPGVLPAIRAVQGHYGATETVDYRGERVLAYSLPVPDSDWSMVVKKDVAEALEGVRRIETATILSFLVLAALAFALWWWWLRSRGRAEQALRESRERFETVFRASPDSITLVTLDKGLFVEVNSSFERFTGYSPAEALGRTALDLKLWMDPAQREFVFAELQAGRAVNGLEARIRRKDGEMRVGLRFATKVEIGGVPHVLSIMRDITEAKRAEELIQGLNAELEQRVRQRTAQLERSNKELETFSYSVAHDLKAPLRGIDGYSRLLLADYSAKLDEQGRQFLRNVRQAAQQMGQLINDLLAYSRLERRDMQADKVDPQLLIGSLLAELDYEIQTRGVAVSVDVSSTNVTADRDGLMMALRNLIENALKFTRGASKPTIEISGHDTGTTRILSIRDNGVGFDMKFHDQIFGIFERLHRGEDYPGTGVGLAIVKKAMERMGGRAWAESEPGKGATFYLEIPK